MARFAGLHHLLVGGVSAIWLASPGATQSEDNSRAVRIIEDPPASSTPSAPSLSPPPPSLQPQSLQSPSLQPPSLQSPSLQPPSLQPPPAPTPLVAPAPPSRPDPAHAAFSPAAAPDMGAIQASLRARNSAGVVVEILPRTDLRVGEKIALRIATKEQGYLVLVDIDAAGKLTQIYPNRRSLLLLQDGQESANLLKPGRPITIPEAGNPFAGFEFVVAPPTGVAMVVAILSDRPVQMLDLPDIPASLVGQGAAIKYLTDWTSNLRIARADASGPLEEAKWSFDAKLYAIR